MMFSYSLVLLFFIILSIVFGLRARRLRLRERSVLRERDQIAFLLANLNDGLLEYDADYRLLRLNQTGEQVLGIAAADFIGNPITMEDSKIPERSSIAAVTYPITGKDTIAKASEWNKSLGMSVDTHELSVSFPEDKRLRVYTVPKIDPRSNKPSGFIKIVRDITKDDIISHSKSDLVAVVAHQMRTPLSGIKWALKALLDGDFGPVTPEQGGIVTKGLSANEDMIRLIDDILDVSKIEAAHFDYTFAEQDVLLFVEECISACAEEAKSRKVVIRGELPTIGFKAIFDAARMRMAISNLIDNAVTYSKEGTEVSVSLADLGDKLKIAIRDTGIGIPADAIPKLFTKFYRADNAKKVKTHGTGLGLFMVKTIVEGHGGTVGVESVDGQGSLFFVELPKKPITRKKPGPRPEKVYGL